MARIFIPQHCDRRNPSDQDHPQSLWVAWWHVAEQLRPAFSHLQTFLWFVLIVAGFIVRPEMMGITSMVRAFNLKPCSYSSLLRNMHSRAIRLDDLCALWYKIVLRIFPEPLQMNGRHVLVADGIKVAKRGKHMPAVKLLHQQSENKAEYIMGHSMQAVCVLVHAAQTVLAVPLAIRIHEGVVFSNRHRKTLLEKMLGLIDTLKPNASYYLVADAYYAAKSMVSGLHDRQSDIITRVKKNAIAFLPYKQDGTIKRGRPRLYGDRVALAALFRDDQNIQQIPSPVYGERNVTLEYVSLDLLWKPTGTLLRFVAVKHPTRGSFVLMSSDLKLSPTEIIRLYGLRFKIEFSFKQAVHQIGTHAYHFWMKNMSPQKQGGGDQYLHRKPVEYRNAVKRKIHAYHTFLQAGVIAQGMLQYLSACLPDLVWRSFGSWLRTIRPGIAPSEFVTATAMRQSLPEFLLTCAPDHSFTKFIRTRQNPNTNELFRMTS